MAHVDEPQHERRLWNPDRAYREPSRLSSRETATDLRCQSAMLPRYGGKHYSSLDALGTHGKATDLDKFRTKMKIPKGKRLLAMNSREKVQRSMAASFGPRSQVASQPGSWKMAG